MNPPTAPAASSYDDPPPPYPGLPNAPSYPSHQYFPVGGQQGPQMGFNIPPPQQAPYQTVLQETVAYQQQPSTIVVVVPDDTTLRLGKHSSTVQCQFCHKTVQTRVETKISNMAHVSAIMLCLFGCWFCCPVPYCLNMCRYQKHYCPSCNNTIGTADAV